MDFRFFYSTRHIGNDGRIHMERLNNVTKRFAFGWQTIVVRRLHTIVYRPTPFRPDEGLFRPAVFGRIIRPEHVPFRSITPHGMITIAAGNYTAITNGVRGKKTQRSGRADRSFAPTSEIENPSTWRRRNGDSPGRLETESIGCGSIEFRPNPYLLFISMSDRWWAEKARAVSLTSSNIFKCKRKPTKSLDNSHYRARVYF